MACPVRNGASKTRGCRNPSVEPWAGMLQEGSQLNAGKTRKRLSNLPQRSSGQFSGPVSDRNSQNRTRCPLGNPSWLHPHGLQPWGMDVDVCFHCSCCCSFWQGAGGTATCWGGNWVATAARCVHTARVMGSSVCGLAKGKQQDQRREQWVPSPQLQQGFWCCLRPVFPPPSEDVVLWVGKIGWVSTEVAGIW